MAARPAAERLTVLIALGDVARAERLASILAAEHDVTAVLDGGYSGNADVVIADGEPLDAVTPHVLLSPSQAPDPRDAIAATLPAGADDWLIAAAARLAATGYRISRVGDPADEGLGGFAGGGGFAEEETAQEPAGRPALSPREMEVLALLAEGAPNKVIARRLDISVHTAKFHVAAILAKLGAANRTDAIAIAMRQGLVLV
jgi:DNA-binding NarL/FixJ family response regulator